MENGKQARIAMYRRSLEHSRDSAADNRVAGDLWPIDTPIFPVGAPRSYDGYFRPLLLEEGALTFQGWLKSRKESGSSAHVLDLFGNGYFVEDLSSVDSITGVRIHNASRGNQRNLREKLALDMRSVNLNVDKKRAKAISIRHAIARIQAFDLSPKCELVEGNLYSQATWKDLDRSSQLRGIPYYDLITAKLEGGLHDSEIFHKEDDLESTKHNIDDIHQIYSIKFLNFADKAYSRLNPNGGMFITEVPPFIVENFLPQFMDIAQGEGGIDVSIAPSRYNLRRNLKLMRQPHSTPNLSDIVHPHFQAA